MAALCAACSGVEAPRTQDPAAASVAPRESSLLFSERPDPPGFAALVEAVEREPASAPARRELALALRSVARNQEALEQFEKAAELGPAEPRHQLELAMAYTSVSRLGEAEAIYHRLVDVPRMRPNALHNLGNIALRRDELERAIDYYRQALEARPDYLMARYHLGVALAQQGRRAEAFDAFQAVSRFPMPQDPTQRGVYFDALYQMSSLSLAAGAHAQAAEMLSKLLEHVPDHPNALYAYGRAMTLLGRKEEAERAFDRHERLPARAEGRIGYLGPEWEAAEAGLGGMWFQDVAGQAGIDYRNLCGDPVQKNWITEAMGAGAGWLDFDGDGALDLYLANGSAYGRPPGGGEPDRLYRGDGRGKFVDVTERAGLGDRGWSYGVAVGDVDHDYDPDLFVTNYGPDVLYRNDGDGTFSDVTPAAGVGDERWGTSAAFFDMELDGDLDLYVGNYLECTPETVPRPGESDYCGFKGLEVMCGPKPLVPSQDVLYRNQGDGTFTDATREAGVWLDPPRYTLGVVTADYDNDGLQDIYVANDSVNNNLWRNLGGGKFVDVGVPVMVATNGEGMAQAGMGTDFGDYDGDGWLDIVTTNFSHDLNTIYRNVEGRYFLDESGAVGLAPSYMALSWGTGFHDLDNDADLDLFVANGHTYPEVDDHALGTTYHQRNHLFVNEGNGRFVESSLSAGPGFAPLRAFRGAAFADYDDDGDVDIAVTSLDDAALLLRNDTDLGNHSLSLRLVGRQSNSDGVGARVTLTAGGRVQIRERQGGGSYLSANDGALHFGLGTAPRAERIEVHWPSGVSDVLENVAAGERLTVREGEGRVAGR
jgi:tetratricopeptide (TPR) repeat protein